MWQEFAKKIKTVGDIVYIGYATKGTATNESRWQIKRVQTVGDTISIDWSSENVKFDDCQTINYGEK